jgi:serine/threonine-protein kinase
MSDRHGTGDDRLAHRPSDGPSRDSADETHDEPTLVHLERALFPRPAALPRGTELGMAPPPAPSFPTNARESEAPATVIEGRVAPERAPLVQTAPLAPSYPPVHTPPPPPVRVDTARPVTFTSTMPPPRDESDFEARYQTGELLGQGGMGEVRLSVDKRIGRAVALKLLKPEAGRRAKLRARFLFEAKVQGQLEHPSIVPVYDIGTRADGSDFFTMKRVHGRTLHDVLKSLRHGDKGTQLAWSRRRLLTALQQVCQAVEFAHRRGVVHRDLKPANIMLGSLGEVSILDWGCAKLHDFDAALRPAPEARAALTEARLSSEETGVGEVLGTPGYMSPEQVAGDPTVDGRTDVFALGAILFETLTFFHLVPGQSSEQVNMTTLRGAYDARMVERFADLDIAQELEDACVAATLHDRSRRMASPMELHEAIERHLEGDRDLKRRRALASKHTRQAIALVAELSDGRLPKAEAKATRQRALREILRAVAIDPENPTALRTMMRLLTEVPGSGVEASQGALIGLSGDATQTRKQLDEASRPKILRRGALAYLGSAGNLVLFALFGVRNWVPIAGAIAMLLGCSALTYRASRQPSLAHNIGPQLAIIVMSCCAIAAVSLLYGPFVYVPSLCVANIVVFAAAVDKPMRRIAIACGALALLVPILGGVIGILPAQWQFEGEQISILPEAVQFSKLGTILLLTFEAVGAVILPSLVVGAERDARDAAEKRLAAQAEALSELLPPEAKSSL